MYCLNLVKPKYLHYSNFSLSSLRENSVREPFFLNGWLEAQNVEYRTLNTE